MDLLDCALMGVCAVIRSNMVIAIRKLDMCMFILFLYIFSELESQIRRKYPATYGTCVCGATRIRRFGP